LSKRAAEVAALVSESAGALECVAPLESLVTLAVTEVVRIVSGEAAMLSI
jgi:hypothetical protein